MGGFVRDLLLNIPSQDFDIVVEGDAIHLAHLLADKFGGKVTAHRRFGTAKWQIKEIHESLKAHLGCSAGDSSNLPETLDMISARTEFYDRPTAYPLSKIPASSKTCTAAISPSTPWRCASTAPILANCKITGAD